MGKWIEPKNYKAPSQASIEAARKAAGYLIMAEMKKRQPIPNKAKVVVSIEIERYYQGQQQGLFSAFEVIKEEGKKTQRILLAEGTDLDICMTKATDAAFARVYK